MTIPRSRAIPETIPKVVFWANGNLIANSLKRRELEKGLFWNQQVRGQAWTLRTLAQAAYILPDEHPFKDYFLEKLSNNAQFYRAAYLEGGHYNAYEDRNIDLSNPLHVVVPGKLEELGRPWMDDFFTFAVAYAVDLGFTEWQPLLEWKAEYPLARMASQEDEYCWIFGATYFARFGTGNGFDQNTARWIPSFRELYLQNWGNRQARDGTYVKDMACAGAQMANYLSERDGRRYLAGEMDGYAASPMGYPANLQPALAYLVDFGLPRADIAWQRLYSRVRFPDYSYYPQFAITPRSLNPGYAVPQIIDFRATTKGAGPERELTLSWSVMDAEICEADGDWQGIRPLTDNITFSAPARDSVFTLRCRNADGTTSRSLLVSAEAPIESDHSPATEATGESVANSAPSPQAEDESGAGAAADTPASEALLGNDPGGVGNEATEPDATPSGASLGAAASGAGSTGPLALAGPVYKIYTQYTHCESNFDTVSCCIRVFQQPVRRQ